MFCEMIFSYQKDLIRHDAKKLKWRDSWGLCMEGLWSDWCFAIIFKIFWMCDMHYHPLVMCLFYLPLKIFGWFVIPDVIQYNLIRTFHKICMLISLPLP